ncbi:DEAD-box ATP-dependent RNA helicase 7 [Gracilariopsis chorda]|uniref:RNA helicase n=1 Tax=Gracilariopsis chorda TaxID=448386 RepID=A0A2V3IZX8_9FLOR|nr:DEAD-box ATP-dependent RNA helicase 7 [Gracilariopsis chorda]|eukprot:PXF47701.1 DEAD-box ATP-dependent RNA helicase 7 [Gracilariopsis chorda]
MRIMAAARPAFTPSLPLRVGLFTPRLTCPISVLRPSHVRSCAVAPTLSSSSNGVASNGVSSDSVARTATAPSAVQPLPALDDMLTTSSQHQPAAAEYTASEPVPKSQTPTKPTMHDLTLSPVTIERLQRNGITHPTEVQVGTFDTLYDGKDVIAKSRTGTGKTLAFALPILERLAILKGEGNYDSRRGPACIVLAPTRELAKQVSREMAYIGAGLKISVECVYGGSSYTPQENALRKGVDVVVGTPGRIMDHLDRGNLRLANVAFAVLDEADEMLSMGFSTDVETIFETLPSPEERQVILFSATVPPWVKRLASQFQKKDVTVFDAITSGTMASTTVRHCAVRVPEREEARASLLADIIAVHSPTKTNGEDGVKQTPSRVIVFTQTKREADDLATSGALDGCGAAVLHGDVSQRQREITLSQFRNGKFQVLVATDVAARGLDISGVDVVVQYRVPLDSESYIHRAGRTGRAGRSGTAVVLYSDRESRNLKTLERDCKIRFDMEVAPAPETALEAAVDVALANVGSVEDRVLKHLIPRAAEIVKGGEDSTEIIAAILAIASRRVRLEDRSVLSGEKGMRTVHVKSSEGVRLGPGTALRLIKELARHCKVDGNVGLIRTCQDGSVVLDVSSEGVDKLLEAGEGMMESTGLRVHLCSGVPMLRDDRRRDNERGGRRDGRRRDGGNGGRFSRGYRDDRRGYAGGGRRDDYGGGGQGRERGWRKDAGYARRDYWRGDRRDDRRGDRRDDRRGDRRDERRGADGGRRSAEFLRDDF